MIRRDRTNDQGVVVEREPPEGWVEYEMAAWKDRIEAHWWLVERPCPTSLSEWRVARNRHMEVFDMAYGDDPNGASDIRRYRLERALYYGPTGKRHMIHKGVE